MVQIDVKNLSFSYDTAPILKNVELRIKEGTFAGIVGPNGSGKTTLAKNIMRALVPERKTVFLSGEDIRDLTHKKLARKLAAVPQSTVIEYDFTVEDIVLMGRAPHIGRFERESKRDFDSVEEAMKRTDIWHLRKRSVREISGGERQRVIIARALAQEPSVLVLDEPVSHLDIKHQIGLMELTKKLCREKNITVLAILHDLNFAMAYCDQVMLVHQGSIKVDGKPEAVLTQARIKEVYDIDVYIIDHPKTGLPYIMTV